MVSLAERPARKVSKGYRLPEALARRVGKLAIDWGCRPCDVVERALVQFFASESSGRPGPGDSRG